MNPKWIRNQETNTLINNIINKNIFYQVANKHNIRTK